MKNQLISKMKTKQFKLYSMAFLIPFLTMMIIFWVQEIFPFGEESFLHIDMYHQYFPFLSEFYHKLKEGESLFHSWNTGIGSNFLALFVYYLATPTNWLSVLFPEQYLMEFISYMVVIKIGLCGLSFAHYLSRHFKTQSYTILLFSGFYALSGYMAAYNWNVMWLDCIVIAPLVILGLERLVDEGDGKLYCLALGFSILTNYYLSIMLCMYLVLYYFILIFCKRLTGKELVRTSARFGLYSLLSGGMAAILLIPEICALQFSEFTKISFPSTLKTYFPIMDVIARHSFNVTVETGLDHWPNIYCGVGVFLFFPLYAMNKDISAREKVTKLSLLAFLLVSFSTNKLTFIWHGLNYPDSLPARQSHLYIILLLTICFEAFLHIKEFSKNEITASLLGVILFLLLSEKLATDDAFNTGCFLITTAFLVIYVGYIHMYRNQTVMNSFLAIMLFLLVFVEAGANTYLTSVPTVSRNNYLSNYDSYRTLIKRTQEQQGDLFRFEKFSRRTNNDATFLGYPGGSYFSSVSNALVKNFYTEWGMKTSKVYYSYDGTTPVTAALLSNRYMLSTSDRDYDNLYTLADKEGSLYLYRNIFTLPLGYMIPEEYIDYENMFSEAETIKEKFKTEKVTNNTNPIEKQNEFVQSLGVEGEVFTSVLYESSSSDVGVNIDEDGHYYAYCRNKKVDEITYTHNGDSKKFASMSKRYLMDLGYISENEYISLKSKNGEKLNISIYKVETDALGDFIDTLSQQTLTIDSYDSTSLNGHITVENPGELVLSVPYEPGWTFVVDGEEIIPDLFEDTFMSTYLSEGEHTISISYYPAGFSAGIIISIISILIFISLIYYNKKLKNMTSRKG